MNSTISIRVASIDDLEAITPLFNEYRIFYEQSDDIVLARRFLTERMRNHQSVVFIAETEDKLVKGFAQLYPVFSSVSAKSAWILNDLFVEKRSRGAGIASALLAAVLRFRKNTNAAWVSLQTAHTNKPAQELYKKFGFSTNKKYLTFTNYSTEETS